MQLEHPFSKNDIRIAMMVQRKIELAPSSTQVQSRGDINPIPTIVLRPTHNRVSLGKHKGVILRLTANLICRPSGDDDSRMKIEVNLWDQPFIAFLCNHDRRPAINQQKRWLSSSDYRVVMVSNTFLLRWKLHVVSIASSQYSIEPYRNWSTKVLELNSNDFIKIFSAIKIVWKPIVPSTISNVG